MSNDLEFKELKLFKKGKVRDVYDLGEQLLLVATDRISCFDFILPTPIPDKGKTLTQVSSFWFSFLKDMVENHLISTSVEDLPISAEDKDKLKGRIMIAKKCEVIPFECVVRGYLSGSGWKEYKDKQSVCGLDLPAGLKESSKLAEPIFTPATKAEEGHDENISFDYMKNAIGTELANKIRDTSVAIYNKAADYALSKGVIIADTKFEFGMYNGKFILIDEVLTPDSSRFWPKDDYEPGRSQASFDKQFVRDYLDASGWDKVPPVPVLPDAVVAKTQEKYKQVLKILTGEDFV